MFDLYLKERDKISHIFESSSTSSDFSEKFVKSAAVDVVLSWLDEENFNMEELNAYLIGIADMDGDGDLDEEEKAVFEILSESVLNLFKYLGAHAETIDEFVSDGEGDALAEIITAHIEDNALSDDEIRSGFISGGAINEKTKVVMRGGIKKMIKVPTKKKRLSAAQKMALKKARKKAFTGAAKMKRSKSMNKRKKMGL